MAIETAPADGGGEPARPRAVRRRRERCYWESTYNPALVGTLKPGEWDFTNQKGPTRLFFDAADLLKTLNNGGKHIIEGVTFSECDFQGLFEFEVQFVFKKCRFLNCDLSLTTWNNTKFAECEFNTSSIGQSIFRRCEFRNCKWERLSFSSNETEFYDCVVSNPADLVGAGYTNLDPDILERFKADGDYQRFRLELNKATIARSLLNNLRVAGDDDTFYQAVACFENQQARGRFSRARYYARNGTRLSRALHQIESMFWLCEWGLLRVFGLINGWGATALRPLLGLVVIFLIFGLAYLTVPGDHTFLSAIITAADISLIAGYTRHATEQASVCLSLVYLTHLGLSLLFYSVFFATIVSKLSRVR